MSEVTEVAPAKISGREKAFTVINKASGWLDALGFSWLVPILKIIAGDSPREQFGELKRVLLIPLIGIGIFLLAWGTLAPKVQTSLGAVPGPAQVWEQTKNLWEDHKREREKADAFYERQDIRNQKLIDAGSEDKVKFRTYTGKPTYLDQIGTSLITVGLGFAIATLIAVPLGIASGLSKTVNGAINPLIQIFKAGVTLGMAPYRDNDCLCSLMLTIRLVAKITLDFCRDCNTLLHVANAYQHCAWCGICGQGFDECGPCASIANMENESRKLFCRLPYH